jgi:hypothetical protein
MRQRSYTKYHDSRLLKYLEQLRNYLASATLLQHEFISMFMFVGKCKHGKRYLNFIRALHWQEHHNEDHSEWKGAPSRNRPEIWSDCHRCRDNSTEHLHIYIPLYLRSLTNRLGVLGVHKLHTESKNKNGEV